MMQPNKTYRLKTQERKTTNKNTRTGNSNKGNFTGVFFYTKKIMIFFGIALSMTASLNAHVENADAKLICPSYEQVMQGLEWYKEQLKNNMYPEDLMSKKPNWDYRLACKRKILRGILIGPKPVEAKESSNRVHSDSRDEVKSEAESTVNLQLEIEQGREGYKAFNENLDYIVRPISSSVFKEHTLAGIKTAGIKTKVISREKPEKTVLYLHGGGYLLGLDHVGNSYNNILYTISNRTNADVYMPDYRLVPENSLTASLEDALAIYTHLIKKKKVDPKSILVAGDSAGGGLALRLLLRLKEKGMPMPGGAILISAWTDKTNSGESVITNEKTGIFAKTESLHTLTPAIIKGVDPRDPFISPLFGDYTGFPPLLYIVGGSEIFYDDTMRDVKKAKAQGVDVQIIEHENGMHIYPVFARFLPEGKDAIEKMISWVKSKI